MMERVRRLRDVVVVLWRIVCFGGREVEGLGRGGGCCGLSSGGELIRDMSGWNRGVQEFGEDEGLRALGRRGNGNGNGIGRGFRG